MTAPFAVSGIPEIAFGEGAFSGVPDLAARYAAVHSS